MFTFIPKYLLQWDVAANVCLVLNNVQKEKTNAIKFIPKFNTKKECNKEKILINNTAIIDNSMHVHIHKIKLAFTFHKTIL